MEKIIRVLGLALGFLIFGHVLAKADQCVSLGGKPFVTPRFSAGFHDSRGRFFFGLGTDRRRYESYYCPGIVAPFQTAPQYQDNPEADTGRSGSGDLYINGYRVMPSGWLRVRVKPPADVELLIDGYPVVIDQKTGMSAIIGFPVGAHSVAARKEGLKPFYSEVQIKQAQLIDVDILLSRQ